VRTKYGRMGAAPGLHAPFVILPREYELSVIWLKVCP